MGASITNQIRRRVRKRHQNVRGESFQDYSTSYADRKMAGKAAGTQASYSDNPDMTLTGKTMDALEVFGATKRSVTWGWVGVFSANVGFLHDTKNYQIVNLGPGVPIHPTDDQEAFKLLNKFYDKEIKKYAREDIKIGR